MPASATLEPADTPAAVARRIPSLDSYRAAEITVSLSGGGRLDHLHEGDLALLESARLGKPVLLLVRGHVRAKTFKLAGPTSDEHLAFVCSVRVDSIEDAGGA